MRRLCLARCGIRETDGAITSSAWSRLRVLQRFVSQQFRCADLLRGDLVPDCAPGVPTCTCYASQSHRHGRLPALLAARGAERGEAYALLVFPPPSPTPPKRANPGINVRAAARFGPRKGSRRYPPSRAYWLIPRGRILPPPQPRRRPAAAPPADPRIPALRRHRTQVRASECPSPVHTVHDYVKALHSHFGVSSRTELLAPAMVAIRRPDSPAARTVKGLFRRCCGRLCFRATKVALKENGPWIR